MPEEGGTNKENIEKRKMLLAQQIGEQVNVHLDDIWNDKATIRECKLFTGRYMTSAAADTFFDVLNAAEQMENRPKRVSMRDLLTGKQRFVLVKNPQVIHTRVFKEMYERNLIAGIETFFHENGEILSAEAFKLTARPRSQSEYEEKKPKSLRSVGLR